MNKYCNMRMIVIALLVGAYVPAGKAATVNTWRGNDVSSDWNESYQWKLNHPPAEGEAAHFRAANSVVSVNSTVQLNNGIHLYGEELLLKGNGNINLWSAIPHERTVNIPASATGHANLTLCDNLSLNGRVSLSAKGFGTSASKGSITLKDRSTVTGGLCIGNEGVGSGQVYVEDNATYRITKLELNTIANKGGMAEIHILGGTVRIDTAEDLFNSFMEDASRKIIIGDTGTLRVDSNLSIAKKKEMIKALIVNKRLVAAPGCFLTLPILQDEMMIARAESVRLSSSTQSEEALLAAIDNLSDSTQESSNSTTADLGELVKALHNETANLPNSEVQADAEPDAGSPHLAGFIVFFGVVLFALRRAPADE